MRFESFAGYAGCIAHFLGMVALSAAAIAYSPLLYLPVVLFHAYHKKCPLTRLEQRLHKQNVTVMDPFLWVTRIDTTNPNRETVTFLTSSVVFLLSCYSAMMSTV